MKVLKFGIILNFGHKQESRWFYETNELKRKCRKRL